MAEIMNSQKFFQALVSLTAQAAYKDLLVGNGVAPSEEEMLPTELRNWLGRLRLLYGVPFAYLIPHEKLLPQESIRFFYIDRNWTDRLVDGALSVGKTSTRDYAHHHAMNDTLMRAADDEERYIRSQLRDANPTHTTAPGGDLTGMLVRSKVVSGWPGLEVRAYKGKPLDVNHRLLLLRMDRLAPDILFCLWNDIPTTVEIIEPREGIRFGVDVKQPPDLENYPSGNCLLLRYIYGGLNDELAGWSRGHLDKDSNHSEVKVAVPVRKAEPSVIHVKNLCQQLRSQLEANQMTYDPPGTPPNQKEFSSADLAVEMLQPPYVQRFEGASTEETENQPAWKIETAYISASFRVGDELEPLSEAEMVKLFGNMGGGG